MVSPLVDAFMSLNVLGAHNGKVYRCADDFTAHPSTTFCCVPCPERILKGELSIAVYIKLNKSQTQPDGGEGYSGRATGYR